MAEMTISIADVDREKELARWPGCAAVPRQGECVAIKHKDGRTEVRLVTAVLWNVEDGILWATLATEHVGWDQ